MKLSCRAYTVTGAHTVQRLSRKELYDPVWSEPMKNLCVRFGISDVALRKTCARAAIPKCPPGLIDDIAIRGGGNYRYQAWSDQDLMAPLPPPPQFEESIEAVRERVAKTIGKLTVPREIRGCHGAIDRLPQANSALSLRNAYAANEVRESRISTHSI